MVGGDGSSIEGTITIDAVCPEHGALRLFECFVSQGYNVLKVDLVSN